MTHTPKFQLERATSNPSHPRTPCILPVEVLERIVLELLFPDNSYAAISGFSLASYQFHQLAVKNYFHTLRVRSMSRAAVLIRIAGVETLVRHLVCPIEVVSRGMFPIHSFRNLTGLEISCFADVTKTIHQKVPQLFPYLPQTLTTLRVTKLPHIGTEMLNAIGDRVTGLVVLELSVVDRLKVECCLLCLEASQRDIMHSPVGPRYDTLEQMIKRYVASLAPLKHLRHLSLGIFTTSLDVLVLHANTHVDPVQISSKVCPGAFHTVDPSHITSPPASAYLPSNCPTCYQMHQDTARTSEGMAARLLAKALPCLEAVRLYSWFGKGGKEGDRETWPRWITINLRRKKTPRVDGGK
ncbi:hypothetical protein OF83DRAFT_1158649 [Amylostereum chailletii]|nr:hypothetical protein OF83DRAFT_1158649 [Amylostereum chailletii]